MPNQPTYSRNPDAIAIRQAEVPGASFINGANYAGNNCVVGIANAHVPATENLDQNPVPNWTLLDQFGAARNPQDSQHIGGSGLGNGTEGIGIYPVNYGVSTPGGVTAFDGEAAYIDGNIGFETINAPPDPAGWAPLPNDLNIGAAVNWQAVDMNISGVAVAVGFAGRVSRSTDYGATWVALAQGAGGTQPAASDFYNVKCVDDGATWLICGDAGYVLRSTDSGATWTTLTQGLGSGTNGLMQKMNTDRNGNVCISNGGYGPIVSTDSGATWTPIDAAAEGLTGCTIVYGIAYGVAGVLIITGLQRYVYRSEDLGATWAALPRGLGYFLGGPSARVNELYSEGNYFLAYSSRANDIRSYVWSFDNGKTWQGYDLTFPIQDATPGLSSDRNGNIVMAGSDAQYSTVYGSIDFTLLPADLNSDATTPDFNAVVGHPNGTFIAVGNETACRINGV